MYIHVLLLHVSCFVCVNFKCYFVLHGVKLTFKRICVFFSDSNRTFLRLSVAKIQSFPSCGPMISRLCRLRYILLHENREKNHSVSRNKFDDNFERQARKYKCRISSANAYYVTKWRSTEVHTVKKWRLGEVIILSRKNARRRGCVLAIFMYYSLLLLTTLLG